MIGDRIENGLAWLCLAALCAWMMGCASVVTPKTPDQTVYAAYGLYTTVTRTTADLVRSGTITVERGQEIQAKLQDVRPLLDEAKAVVDGGNVPEETTMRLVRAIMERLQAIQLELQEAS